MSALVASPVRFSLDTLEPFLVRISQMIPCGFGELEIAQVVGTAESLKVGEEDELVFHVEHDGEPSRLRIQMRMGDSEGPDVRFFAPAALAQMIDGEIKRMDA